MSDTTASSTADGVPDFELSYAGAGPDPFSLSAAAADPDVDAVVLPFQRDYPCGNCRKQVRAIGDRDDEFEALNAAVVSILPEPVERASEWQESYDRPFALLADPNADVSEASTSPCGSASSVRSTTWWAGCRSRRSSTPGPASPSSRAPTRDRRPPTARRPTTCSTRYGRCVPSQ
nr:redoxin domain-containing protein [Halorubrum rubrum]